MNISETIKASELSTLEIVDNLKQLEDSFRDNTSKIGDNHPVIKMNQKLIDLLLVEHYATN